MNTDNIKFDDYSATIISHLPPISDDEKIRIKSVCDRLREMSASASFGADVPENHIVLSVEEYSELIRQLASPPKPNERLVKLMAETSVLERGDIPMQKELPPK